MITSWENNEDTIIIDSMDLHAGSATYETIYPTQSLSLADACLP